MLFLNYVFLFFVGFYFKNGVFGHETQYCWKQTCLDCDPLEHHVTGEQARCDEYSMVKDIWLGSSAGVGSRNYDNNYNSYNNQPHQNYDRYGHGNNYNQGNSFNNYNQASTYNTNSYNQNGRVEVACIKMVAKDTRQSYERIDIIRGCTVTMLAQATCDSLVAIEKGKGKDDVRCSYCTGDLCNGSGALTSSLVILLLSFLISKIINN